MEILKKQYLILRPFAKQAWKKFTFKEIKKLANNKSDNYVHTTLKHFVSLGLLQKQKIGNNVIYSLTKKTASLNTIGFITEHEANSTKHLPHANIQKLINKLKTAFYVLIVTGSYAKTQQKETSDLDIVIICDNKQTPNAILSQIKLESELMIPEVHPYVFTQEQFYQMLTAKEENYGKEIARNNLIITGAKIYYTILMDAIEHGFNN